MKTGAEIGARQSQAKDTKGRWQPQEPGEAGRSLTRSLQSQEQRPAGPVVVNCRPPEL